MQSSMREPDIGGESRFLFTQSALEESPSEYCHTVRCVITRTVWLYPMVKNRIYLLVSTEYRIQNVTDTQTDGQTDGHHTTA